MEKMGGKFRLNNWLKKLAEILGGKIVGKNWANNLGGQIV